MALTRGPYQLGDDIRLRSSDRTPSPLVLRAPDGAVFPISTERGTATFRATMPGSWTYEWGNGETGTILVLEPKVPDTPEFIDRVEAG